MRCNWYAPANIYNWCETTFLGYNKKLNIKHAEYEMLTLSEHPMSPLLPWRFFSSIDCLIVRCIMSIELAAQSLILVTLGIDENSLFRYRKSVVFTFIIQSEETGFRVSNLITEVEVNHEGFGDSKLNLLGDTSFLYLNITRSIV